MKTVQTANGLVQGQIKNVQGHDIVQFLSIPYCKPPIGELRFQKPQRCETFSERVINKLKFETCPPQLHLNIFDGINVNVDRWTPTEAKDENCLYLNVWCPLEILDGESKHPVYVWIHGGGYMIGSSSLPIYDGSILASKENIIVVTINYRLGIFGFLHLDDDLTSGNLGIWDQVMALQWIHENISTFKGDPSRITLAGNSAGGSSVSLHLLIENSWEYFSKAMIHSGVCFSDWAILPKSDIIQRSEIIVNRLLEKHGFPAKWDQNLPNKDKKSVISFLQNLDFDELLNGTELYQGMGPCNWTPFVDGELIRDDPYKLFSNGAFKQCPTVFLNAENEGDFFVLFMCSLMKMEYTKLLNVDIFSTWFKYFPRFPIECDASIGERIKEKYAIAGDKLSIDIFSKILADQHIVCDQIELADIIARSNKMVYYLWFRTLTHNDYWPEWCGVMHADEVYYLFGHPLANNRDDPNDERITSIEFMKQIGNFIKCGYMPEALTRYNESSRVFIAIDKDKWTVEPFSEDQISKVKFWRELKDESDPNNSS